MGTVGCHTQHYERCPGLVSFVHPGEVAQHDEGLGTRMPLKTQIRQAQIRQTLAWEQQAEGLGAGTSPSSESRVMKWAWIAWGTGVGVHVWAGWGGITEGYLLEMVSGFFPVKQFSRPFPWNVLTLKFKISAAAMGGAKRGN